MKCTIDTNNKIDLDVAKNIIEKTVPMLIYCRILTGCVFKLNPVVTHTGIVFCKFSRTDWKKYRLDSPEILAVSDPG